MPKITLPELEQWLWEAANILRGPVDRADFKSYIFPLLFFKRISDIYDEVDSDFRNDWHNNNITRTVAHRLNQILDKLNVSLSEHEMIELVRLHEEMELVFRPDFVTGVHEAIARLSEHYQLGIISDAIFSPGRVLRTLLRDEGLLDYFDTFAFSDEVGHSKPHQSMFEEAVSFYSIGFP